MGRRYFPFEMAPSKRGTFVGFRGRKKWSISVDVLDGGRSLTHATSWSSWQEVSSIPSFVGFFPHPILKKICASQNVHHAPQGSGMKIPKKSLEVSPPRFRFGSVSNRSEDIMRISKKKLLNLTPPEKNTTPPLNKTLLAVLMAELGVESRRKSRLPPTMLKLLKGFLGTLQPLKNPYHPEKLNGWKFENENPGNPERIIWTKPSFFSFELVIFAGVYDIHYTDWFIGILILAYFLLPI